MSNEILSIIAVIFISLISLVGVSVLIVNKKFLNRITEFLVSLAAGSLVGGAFIHIIPEVFEHSHDFNPSILFIVGIIIFFILEKLLYWHHCHKSDPDMHNTIKPFAVNNLIADGIHNFLDGILIASSFGVSVEIGIATTIAVILHEIPQEFGDFGVLIHAGIKPKRALILNFSTALIAVLGAIFAITISTSEEMNLALLSIAGGGFIYIALADLIPEISKEESFKKNVFQIAIFIIGILMMYGLSIIEIVDHSH